MGMSLGAMIIWATVIWYLGDFTAALPQITKITNGTLKNVTISSQRTIETYGQAIIGLLQSMKPEMTYFVLTRSEQLCIPIWKSIASQRSVQAQFFIAGDPLIKSVISKNNILLGKIQLTLVSNLKDSQLTEVLSTVIKTKLIRWTFIMLGDRIPIQEFMPLKTVIPPIFCVEFDYHDQRKRNKPITFYDYQYNVEENEAILIPFMSWKTGILRFRKAAPSKKIAGIFQGRKMAVFTISNPPITGYGQNDEANSYGAGMLQNLNDFLGNRIIIHHSEKHNLPINTAADIAMTYYGTKITSTKSLNIPTMGKFCTGFAFLKVEVHPTADVFINPFPKEIWIISIIAIFSGHIILKVQMILLKVFRRSTKKVGFHELIFVDVDEDLRLARSLRISMLSIKLVAMPVILTSFMCHIIYSTMFSSDLTNMKDMDIPYHSTKEFYEKWQMSSKCYSSYSTLRPVIYQKTGINANKDNASNFFLDLVIDNAIAYGVQAASITEYVNEPGKKECYIDYLDVLKYIFNKRCDYGMPKDTILCMDMAPIAFETWFPFVELYQHALLRLKENGIATRLRQQFITDYKDCSHVSFLKPIELSVIKYILITCVSGSLASISVSLFERLIYKKYQK